MKRFREWLYHWFFGRIERECRQAIIDKTAVLERRIEAEATWRGDIVSDVEQRLATDRELRDAVLNDLVSQINKLREQLNERQAELPAGRRVARTFSEFRAAAEGRPKEKR